MGNGSNCHSNSEPSCATMCVKSNPWILVAFRCLAAAFRMSIELQGVYDQSSSVVPPLQVGDFESEIEILKARMAKTAVDVMKPFLQFSLQFVAD